MEQHNREKWLQTLEIIANRQPDQAEATGIAGIARHRQHAVIVKATVPAFTQAQKPIPETSALRTV